MPTLEGRRTDSHFWVKLALPLGSSQALPSAENYVFRLHLRGMAKRRAQSGLQYRAEKISVYVVARMLQAS